MSQASAEAIAHADRVVLVADDEAIVRTLVTRMLTTIGIGTVLPAENGSQLLEQMTVNAQIDLVICDLKMPGMDGIEVLRHLSYRHARTGLVIISSADAPLLRTVQQLAEARGLRLLGILQKPISKDALAAIIARLDEPFARPGPRNMVAIDAKELSRGIRADEITAFFQPKVSIADGRVVGCEALARWQHPDLGLLTPDSFIPAAEDGGLIDPLGDAVLAAAIAQASHWHNQGLDLDVAVNMSVTGLSRLDLPERIASLSAVHGLPLGRVAIEVTETGLIHDIATVFDVITRLGLMGIKLSIDDFGTGYSTMQQLVRLPFTELKLDQSFVRGAAADDRVRTVLEFTIAMAHQLGLVVVAEGIETEDHWMMLRRFNCAIGQGYWISRPMPGTAVVAWSGAWQLPSTVRSAPARAQA